MTLFFLGAAHLAVKAFFPNPAFWLIGAGAIVAGGTLWLTTRRDEFAFWLVIFGCAHFAFADQQGGLWSYVVDAIVPVAILRRYRFAWRTSAVPPWVRIAVIVSLAHQVAGTLLNPYGLAANVQSLIITVSHLLVFFACASAAISTEQLKKLLSVAGVMTCWVLIMGLNQHFHWVITPSPLLPQRAAIQEGEFSMTPAGAFGNSELFGEFFAVVLTIAVTLVSHSEMLTSMGNSLRLGAIALIPLAVGGMIISSSRAAVLLGGAGIGMILMIELIVMPSARTVGRVLTVIAAAGAVVVMMIAMGGLFDTDDMVADFAKLNPAKMNMESVLSGDQINRGYVYEAGFHRLSQESWWLGYGYNLPENNRISMRADEAGIADYHSLYLCLPIFYGWLGAVAYVALIAGTAIRLGRTWLRARKAKHPLAPLALGVAAVWAIFLLDQYKISVTRNPSYYLLTWFWLGWSHALANALSSAPVPGRWLLQREARGGKHLVS